jgi:hypothetical protein
MQLVDTIERDLKFDCRSDELAAACGFPPASYGLR